MTTFRFKPSARLQKYLGNELIADPNLAIIEFVKNAYDAGASQVKIKFDLAGSPPSLTIQDDGAGMDRDDFERNWMHPGYSEKSPDAPTAARRRAERASAGRTPAGEKGLGRLAAGRLGTTLEVFTRKRANDPWLHVVFDWAEFDNMSRLIDDVRIPFDHGTSPASAVFDKGTILVVSGLTQRWDSKVVGRPTRGRKRTRLGRLKQDLELLLRPLRPRQQTFEIDLQSDRLADPSDPAEVGRITPQTASDDGDYVYDFSFRRAGGKTRVTRHLVRSKELLEEIGGGRRERDNEALLDDALTCGSFHGRFLYSPPARAHRAKEIDVKSSGVLLYRDGVLVEPYGIDDDDWVGVAARKAQRQGYALVQPVTFSGYVEISRETNPALRDMSNRQGLLDNDESEAFLKLVREEFTAFEKIVVEDLSKRWEPIAEKAAQLSEASTRLAALQLRAMVHSIGQPLAGIGADLTSLRIVAARDDLPTDVKKPLLDIADSIHGHLGRAQEVLQNFRKQPVTKATRVSTETIINRALTSLGPLARSLGVSLIADSVTTRKVLVPEELVVEALKELVSNALEAPRRGTVRRVHVGARSERGDVIVDVKDNGTGLRANGDGWMSTSSTKGRPGQGLKTVKELVGASRGSVGIAQSDSRGTHIELRLPTTLSGVRELTD
jgi:signal transduction histidine kinase